MRPDGPADGFWIDDNRYPGLLSPLSRRVELATRRADEAIWKHRVLFNAENLLGSSRSWVYARSMSLQTIRRPLKWLLVLLPVVFLTVVATAAGGRTAAKLSPAKFTEVSSGVVLIQAQRCDGTPFGQGTGFLIGTTVVLTARHVLEKSCRSRVLSNGKWIDGGPWTDWYGPNYGSVKQADLATLKLTQASTGYVFSFREVPMPLQGNVAMVGYPPGNRLQLTQGPLLVRPKLKGKPKRLLGVRLLGAEGASGSPLLDDSGRVIGILQEGLGSKDVLGQRTSGLILGIDLESPTVAESFCPAYPLGGIPGCSKDSRLREPHRREPA